MHQVPAQVRAVGGD